MQSIQLNSNQPRIISTKFGSMNIIIKLIYKIIALGFISLALTFHTVLYAEEINDSSEGLFSSTSPISVNSNSLKILNKGKLAIYTGNVTIVQNKLTLTAEKVEITKKDNIISLIEATGNPVILVSKKKDKPFYSESNKLNYNRQSGWLILSEGSPFVIQKDNEIKGRIIKFHSKSENIEALGYPDKRALLKVKPL